VLIFVTCISLVIYASSSSVLGKNDFFFICEEYNETRLTCYPSEIHVDGQSTTGTSTKIYTITSEEADYSTGHQGKALILNAYLGEYLDINQSELWSFQNFSVSFWIKKVAWFNSNAPILSFTDSEGTAGWSINMVDDGSAVQFGITSEQGKITAPENIPIEQDVYVNVIGIFDGSSVKLYRNGKLYDQLAYNGIYNPDPKVRLRIGLESFSFENSWAGEIDDLQVYNRTLNDQEVYSIQHNGKAANRPVGHWPFEGNLKDISGNNNHGFSHSQAASMSFAPDGRMFFTEKRTGEVKIMKDDQVFQEPFTKISGLYFGDHEGLLGLTLDPEFTINHFVYLYVTYEDEVTGEPFNGVLRLTDRNNIGTNLTWLIDKIPADPDGNYAGGALAFGPDEKLYVSVGMGPRPRDTQNTSSLLGKLLRMNKDGTVPEDNPFGNSSLVYTLGHRSIFGIAFDKSGRGIITENGDSHFDELNMVKKGGNYGFPNSQYPSLSSIMSKPKFIEPLRAYDRVIAPAQAIFYSGSRYPQLNDRLVVASYNDGNLHAVQIREINSTTFVDDLAIEIEHEMPDHIISVAESPNGDIYYGGYNIYKLKSLSSASSRTVFPVIIKLRPGVDIKEMYVPIGSHNILAHISSNVSSSHPGNGTVQMEIPTELVGRLHSVSASPWKETDAVNNKTMPLITYKIYNDEKNDTNSIFINLGKAADLDLSVNGGVYQKHD
jgi:glucose/arabinose dehydrogenase